MPAPLISRHPAIYRLTFYAVHVTSFRLGKRGAGGLWLCPFYIIEARRPVAWILILHVPICFSNSTLHRGTKLHLGFPTLCPSAFQGSSPSPQPPLLRCVNLTHLLTLAISLPSSAGPWVLPKVRPDGLPFNAFTPATNSPPPVWGHCFPVVFPLPSDPSSASLTL